jgi:hypothetical protein
MMQNPRGGIERPDPVRRARLLAVSVLLASACGTPETGTFVGTITDEMCPDASHAHMRMGATDAECTTACVLAHGVRYALFDGSRTYVLSDHHDLESFAAQIVTITGRLDPGSMTIQVESIAAGP